MYKEAQQPRESNFLKILFCILSATKLSGADGSEWRLTRLLLRVITYRTLYAAHGTGESGRFHSPCPPTSRHHRPLRSVTVIFVDSKETTLHIIAVIFWGMLCPEKVESMFQHLNYQCNFFFLSRMISGCNHTTICISVYKMKKWEYIKQLNRRLHTHSLGAIQEIVLRLPGPVLPPSRPPTRDALAVVSASSVCIRRSPPPRLFSADEHVASATPDAAFPPRGQRALSLLMWCFPWHIPLFEVTEDGHYSSITCYPESIQRVLT